MTRLFVFWVLALAVFCALSGKAIAAGEPQADGVQKLAGQLQSDDAFVRLKAARALGAMGPAAAPALPGLEKLLKDPDDDVRGVAAAAVQKIKGGAVGGADIDKLVGQLSDPDAMVRLKAAKTLGEKGAAAQSAAGAMEKLLKDPDEDVRLVAGGALKKIGAKATESAGADTGTTNAGAAKAADIQVVRTVSLYCKGYTAIAGLKEIPSQRFVMAVLKNNGTSAVRIGAMKLVWLDAGGRTQIDAEDVAAVPDVILPGAETATWFKVPCLDESRKWRLVVEHVTPVPLSEDMAKELQQNEQLRKKLKIVLAKPLKEPTLGVYIGDVFTINNPEARLAKNVRVMLCGYDEDRQLVRVLVYHLAKVPDGDTTIDLNMTDFVKMERAKKLASLEDMSDAAKEVDVVKYQAEVLAVGVEQKRD